MKGRGDNWAVTEISFAHVTTKTWAYSGLFGFIRKKCWQKKTVPTPELLLKNTMGNPFWERPFVGTKHSKIKFRTVITRICVFRVWALPEVRDQTRKQFFDEVLYNYCSKQKNGAFRPKK